MTPFSRAERLVCISGFWMLSAIAEIGAWFWLDAKPVFSIQLELVALVFIGLAALIVRKRR